MRMRQPGEPENPGGQQLVVSRYECSRRIEHVDAFGCEPLQLAGAALDAVELVPDVEPGERHIAGLEDRERALRLEHFGLESRTSVRRRRALRS